MKGDEENDDDGSDWGAFLEEDGSDAVVLACVGADDGADAGPASAELVLAADDDPVGMELLSSLRADPVQVRHVRRATCRHCRVGRLAILDLDAVQACRPGVVDPQSSHAPAIMTLGKFCEAASFDHFWRAKGGTAAGQLQGTRDARYVRTDIIARVETK